jgi:predicted porin
MRTVGSPSAAMAWAKIDKNIIALLISPLILAAFCAPGKAADVGETLKSALNDGGPITWNGVTFYGNIDVGGQYESNGLKQTNGAFTGPGFLIGANKGSMWQVVPNASSISFWGISFDEPLPYDTRFVGKLESGFNPLTGELDNVVSTVKMMNGIPLAQQTYSGDGGRAGQVFNGEAYGGFSNPLFGTLTVGRQYSIAVDAFAQYDQLLSLGFSVPGFYGNGTGMGGLETGFINSSVKYRNKFGPFSAEFLYSAAGDSFTDTIEGKIGFDYGGFSASAIGAKVNDNLTLASLGGAANLGSNLVGAKVADTTTWGLFAKYRIDLGGSIPIAGGKSGGVYKADAPLETFTPSLTISGGYENIRKSNPADGGFGVGHTTIGGYQIGPVVTLTGLASAGIVNNGFTGGDQILEVPFVTARYTWDPQWTAAVGWYQQRTNSFGFGVINPAFYSPVPCSNASFSNCSGYIEAETFRVDYAYTKHITFYGGMAYTTLHGGAQFGFLSTTEIAQTIGVRYRW